MFALTIHLATRVFEFTHLGPLYSYCPYLVWLLFDNFNFRLFKFAYKSLSFFFLRCSIARTLKILS